MPYSVEFLTDIDRTITLARLSRYLAATGGKLHCALQLYEANVLVSEALFGFLHGLEVAVRNSLHVVFSRDIAVADWYVDGLPLPWPPPTPSTLAFPLSMKGMIADARSKAGPRATVGKVMAELPFGFWTALVGNRFDPIWRHSLHAAFPHAKLRRQLIHWRLDVIRFLRNRIAHHEPILSSGNHVYTGHPNQPTIRLTELLECVHWISPATAEWLRTSSRYEIANTVLSEVAISGIHL